MEKLFETHGLTANPLPFIFHTDHVERNKETADYTFSNWHINLEILCFIKGSGEVFYGGETLKVAAGDMVIINSNVPHAFRSDTSMDYHCIIPDSEFCRSNAIDTCRLTYCPVVRDEEAFRLCRELVQEFTGISSYREAGIRSAALALLLYLTRNYTEEATFMHGQAKEEGIRIALGYMQANMQEKITVDELATVSGFSKYYFMREFKRLTGDSPVVFLHKIRCENAKKLLRSDSYSIREICEKCGFEDLSYFGKIFKRYEGCSPTEYAEKLDKQ